MTGGDDEARRCPRVTSSGKPCKGRRRAAYGYTAEACPAHEAPSERQIWLLQVNAYHEGLKAGHRFIEELIEIGELVRARKPIIKPGREWWHDPAPLYGPGCFSAH